MGVRLNKVLSELNIGLQTAVDFLKKKNSLGEVKEDATPNTKISDEQYEALVNEFNRDKAIKKQAEMIFPKKKEKEKEKKKEEETIKTEVRQQFKPLGKIDLDSLNKRPAAPAPNSKGGSRRGGKARCNDCDRYSRTGAEGSGSSARRAPAAGGAGRA